LKRDFSALQGRQFDLLICGGGIYGAWTAYDAALRGLRVAIVEQGDWAGATSSSSSKLIHGGLRYLESYDFKLVKKALAERQMLLRVAPHRVWLLRFGVPVYTDSRISRLQLKAGLMIYDFLAASLGSGMAHRYFNRHKFSARFSLLDNLGLKGGFTYSDAQTDDARLVLELIDGALQAGAVCVNYCRLNTLAAQQDQIKAANLQDQLSSSTAAIQAKQIVYASGQWLAAATESAQWCRVTKGVHLILPASLPDEALLLTAPSDGRVFFMIPWYGLTLIGTTDTDYNGDMSRVVVEEADVAYLLEAANHYLKKAWSKADVISSYAGLRVMKRSELSSPSAVSRDWELKTDGNGVHYSIGGKLTSAREDAAAIVDKVCEELGSNIPCASKDRLLPWAPEENYASWSAEISRQATKLNIDQESCKWLMRRHGSRVTQVLKEVEINPALAERISASVPFIYADLLFCARHEMAVHLEDLLRRRMPLFLLSKITPAELRRLADFVSSVQGWGEQAVTDEIAACSPYLSA
jgi:glycerol-3-phosphate dehydrogenase